MADRLALSCISWMRFDEASGTRLNRNLVQRKVGFRVTTSITPAKASRGPGRDLLEILVRG